MNRAASATWLGCKVTSVRAVFAGTVGLELVAEGRLFFFEDVLTIAVRSFATQPDSQCYATPFSAFVRRECLATLGLFCVVQ